MTTESSGKKSDSLSKAFVWVILLLLIVGLGGFGVSNFGGNVQTVGAVGDTEIEMNDYYNAVQQELRVMSAQTGQQTTLAQAEQFSQLVYGAPLTERVMGQLIANTAVENETARIGLSVGDEQVRDQLMQVQGFQGINGDFDRDAYRFALQRIGMSERDYEADLRAETARTLLQAAVVGGVTAPEVLSETVVGYAGQRRGFNWIELDADQLATPVGAPDDTALATYYDANAADFTTPETKRITYIWLTPDMLLGSIDVDEDGLRALYDERRADYVRAERRLVERLVFGSAEDATTALTRLTAEEISFDDLVTERGLSLADIDLGDVTKNTLDTAGDAVFALEEPGVTGVVDTNLGPALFRVNAILAATETSFEDAREELLDEYATDRARRIISDSVTQIDDLLAGGASLQEVADETEMQLASIDWTDETEDGIAGYSDFRTAARLVADGDFAEVGNLDDGGIFALELEEVIAPALQPLDTVRDAAIAGWQAQETMTRLKAEADVFARQIGLGVAPEDFGLTATVEAPMTRDSFIDGTPNAMIRKVFDLGVGESAVVAGDAAVFIVHLSEVLPPDLTDEDTIVLAGRLKEQLSQGISQDIFSAFTNTIEETAGLSLNQSAIAAVNAQIP